MADIKDVANYLSFLAAKRKGGEYNFKGIYFQVLYSCYSILKELSHRNETYIKLEGIEDIDFYNSIKINENLYVQVKFSKNTLTASSFWEMGVLKNFLEVYLINPASTFKLVHNMDVRQGELLNLANHSFTSETVSYWHKKISDIVPEGQDFNLLHFLSRIQFQKHQVDELRANCHEILYNKYTINTGAETQYLKALFYNVFEWSKSRATITAVDLNRVITEITDSFSKAPINPAITNNWISYVDFKAEGLPLQEDYFEGLAAKPIHIAQELPVRRLKWEQEIEASIKECNTVVINASSGQGKSTLCWQVAKNLKDEGCSIYELNFCNDWNEAIAIRDFIAARLRIGEVPVIVLDGLTRRLRGWDTLIDLVATEPVKFLVTSREEDWYRYGADFSRVGITMKSLKMTLAEAQEIYKQLKKKDKISNEILGWQQAWERVAEKGLLIEYTYLLTRGELLKWRLEQQVKTLGDESDAAAKIEILRLVCLADCLNIKLNTSKLVKSVTQRIGFRHDRDLVLQQLEREYYLQLSSEYVEGLHPVRSKHLVEILHKNLPISESLLELFSISDENAVYDYALSVSNWVDESHKKVFYSKLASLMCVRKPPQIVFVLDGLLHAEAQRFWKENKQKFDEAYETGGIELFSIESIPFIDDKFLNNLGQSIGPELGENLMYLANKAKELPKFNVTKEDTDLFLFVKALTETAESLNVEIHDEGLEFLVKWFDMFNFPFPKKFDLSAEFLLKTLHDRKIEEVKEVYAYFKKQEPDKYKQFTVQHKELIISILKVKSNSLSISESENQIYIEYLLDEGTVDNINELSVYRIELVYHFLPYYERYNTEAIILPFPSAELYEVVQMNARKSLSEEALHHKFNIHINRIWAETIKANYRHSSMYDWQNEQIKLRTTALEFCKSCVRMFDSNLEKNVKKNGKAIQDVVESANKFLLERRLKKMLPEKSLKYYDEPSFRQEIRTIDEWLQRLVNFINQFSCILKKKTPDDCHTAHVAMVNLKHVAYDLHLMQEAFNLITDKTFLYFDTTDLMKHEMEWYDRLLTTLLFFIDYSGKESTKIIRVARNEAEEWVKLQRENKLADISGVIREAEDEVPYTFYTPDKLAHKALWDELIIGVEGCNFSDENESIYLLSGLKNLAEIELEFITILAIQNGEAYLAMRFKREYFEILKDVIDNGAEIKDRIPAPLPIQVTDDLLSVLGGRITKKEFKIKPTYDNIVKMMFDVWKLLEHRNRLDCDYPLEANWKLMSEKELEENINKYLLLESNNPNTIKYRSDIEAFLLRKKQLKIPNIVQYLNEYSSSILDEYLTN